MANYHKRNSIRAVQWDPENAQSFEDIKKLIAENPGIGWKADNIVRNDASDNIIIRSFGMIVLRIKPYEYLVEGKKDSLFTVPPETFELMYESDESRMCGMATAPIPSLSAPSRNRGKSAGRRFSIN